MQWAGNITAQRGNTSHNLKILGRTWLKKQTCGPTFELFLGISVSAVLETACGFEVHVPM